MYAATKQDKELVVRLIAETFSGNPALEWMMRKNGDQNRHLRYFAAYAFHFAWIRNGVWISDNGKAALLAYRSDRQRFDPWTFLLWLRLGFTTLRIRRIPAILTLEKYRRGRRPSTPHYYIWFMGAMPESDRAAFEIRSGMLDMAKRDGIPIFLETSVKRNHAAFERMGFETYHRWKSQDEKLEFWFMRSR